jgi:hypothetical protein
MEDRITEGLYLETTDLSADAYAGSRVPEVLKCPGVRRATWWRNANPNRPEFPRTVEEFSLLGVYELDGPFSPPEPAEGVRGHHFYHYPRPGQGSMSGEPTTGILLVWISPKTAGGAQALRDWADFIHLRYIAEAAVPGYRMITPYEAVSQGSPRFMHFYEMHSDNPEGTFKSMSPLVQSRLDERTFDEWMNHEELSIDYVNTFSLIDQRLA